MENTNSGHIISVDSETGFYWKGERIIRNKELIKAVIEHETSQEYENQSKLRHYFSAMNLDQESSNREG